MDGLAPDIQIVIKKAAEWTLPHTPENIKPVVGKFIGLKNSQYLKTSADQFPFSEFILKHMNGPFKFSNEPIKKPLLAKLSSVYSGEALEIFKIILLLTTENYLSPKEESLLSDYIVCRCISCPELRDEIILQVLNQTNSVSSDEPVSIPLPPPPPGILSSADNGVIATNVNTGNHRSWRLLADLLSCVKPSFKFQNYILSYLSNGDDESYESFCFDKLQQNSLTREEFTRCYPPCMLEKFANYHCCMALSCSFSDESIGCSQVTSWMVAEDFAASFLINIKNLPADHTSGWTIALRDLQGLFECQSGDFVMDLISELEVPENFCSQSANFVVTKLSNTPFGRCLREEHPHCIQRKRLLLEPGKYPGEVFTRNSLFHRTDLKDKQSIASAKYDGHRSESLMYEGVVDKDLSTDWIDDVFQRVLDDDASYVASKIKGGEIEDQLQSGRKVSVPQFATQPNSYVTPQPMMPVVVANPQMMYHPGVNPVMCQQSSSSLDHLFFYVDPRRRMQANELRIQLESKELEMKLLEKTLQTEVLKYQLQEIKNCSIPPRQQQQQQTRLPFNQQHQQSFDRQESQPLQPQRNTETAKKPFRGNQVTFETLPAPYSGEATAHDGGEFHVTSASADTFRKVGRLGRITWPPEELDKVEDKPKFNPRKLLIDEKKGYHSINTEGQSSNNIEGQSSRTFKNPPMPPPKKKHFPMVAVKDIEGHLSEKHQPITNQDDNQKPDVRFDATALSLSCVRMKLEEIFSKGSTSKEPPTPDNEPAPQTTTQTSTNNQQQTTTSDKQQQQQHPKLYTRKTAITYTGVDWELEIRKEYFSPQEKLENKTSIDLIFRQVIKDGFSKNCARLTSKCFKELRDVFGKLGISGPSGSSSSSSLEMKVFVIEVAKKLPFYFSKIYPIKSIKDGKEIHQIAVGCRGISLLTFTDDLTFDVFQFIRFEEITKIEVKSKTEVDIESTKYNLLFYSPKAEEIQRLIAVHKKEKYEFESTLEAYKNNYYDKMIDRSFVPISRQLSMQSSVDIPKQPSPDDGIVVRVYAGSRVILVEVLPEMNVPDVIEFICSIIGINPIENRLELVLRLEQGQIWTSLMLQSNAFSLAVEIFKVPRSKFGSNEVVGEVYLSRGAWINVIDLSKSSSAYLDLLYHQSISDYLCGYYLPISSSIVPVSILEEISVLAALQFLIENPNSLVFEEGVEKYLPRNVWSMVDLDLMCPVVLKQCEAIQGLKPDDRKILSLEILSKWPMFGSSFFQAICITSDKTSNECIVAIHKLGVYLLNKNTNVVMFYYPYKKGVFAKIDESNNPTMKIILWIGRKEQKSSSIQIISREKQQILALLDLHNSLLK